MSTDRLYIFDTTLRDGEQAPGFSLRTEQKLRLARQLEALGVDIMEVGFPRRLGGRRARGRADRAGGPRAGDRRAGALQAGGTSISWADWCAARRGRPRIHTFIATSDLHLEHKLRLSREECLRAVRGLRRPGARGYTDDVEFSAEDAIRSDMDFLCRVVDTAIAAGGDHHSTCPIPSATRSRARSRRSSAR